MSEMYSAKETKSSPWFLEKKRHSPASSSFTSSSSTTPTLRYLPKFSPGGGSKARAIGVEQTRQQRGTQRWVVQVSRTRVGGRHFLATTDTAIIRVGFFGPVNSPRHQPYTTKWSPNVSLEPTTLQFPRHACIYPELATEVLNKVCSQLVTTQQFYWFFEI